MNTPILDFTGRYEKSSALRFHMPGHTGKPFLGFEGADITEITGADSLYECEGIIAQSERNASSLFGCRTFYSTEGSSQCISGITLAPRIFILATFGASFAMSTSPM